MDMCIMIIYEVWEPVTLQSEQLSRRALGDGLGIREKIRKNTSVGRSDYTLQICGMWESEQDHREGSNVLEFNPHTRATAELQETVTFQ